MTGKKQAKTNVLEQTSDGPIRKVSTDHYMVDSSTQTLVAYHLERNEFGVWQCSCEGYHYRLECKHVRLLEAHLEDERQAAYHRMLYGLEAQAPKPKRTLESLYEVA